MILLTGAAGFIGSNVLQAFNDRGQDDIICVDDLTNGLKCQNLAGKKFHRYYDYRDTDLDVLFKQHEIDEVVHLGANVDTTNANGYEMMRDNYTYSVKLFDRLSACNWSESRMIYASSAAVYGQCVSWKERSTIGPDTACVETPDREYPRSPYAVSKWMFDEFARRWFDDVEAIDNPTVLTGLRFFNVYGPGEQHKGRMRSAIGNMFDAIKNGRRPTLFDGSQWIRRDFVWIGDVVKTVLWAFDSAPFGIFNVGTGVASSFYDVYNAVAAATAYDDHPQYVDFPTDLPNYQYFTRADLTNLRAAGFSKGFTSLEDGVGQYARMFPV